MIYPEMDRYPHVQDDVLAERERQTALIRRGVIPFDCADPEVSAGLKLAVLGEEFGEVCKALNENEPPADLYVELVQVAAVATAWAESLLETKGAE